MRMTFVGDDQGASAVLVAILLPVLFGMAMLVIDAGAVWSARRLLVTGTDASALAAARGFVKGENGCTAAPALLEANVSAATLTDCVPTANASGGYVQTQAHTPVNIIFGGVLGVGDQQVSSSSVAMWGPLRHARGIRPITICVEEPNVQAWLESGMVPADPPAVHRISFTKNSPDLCGASAPGNWGWLDLDGGSNSNAELIAWLRDGFGNDVGVGDCRGDETGEPCDANTGSRSASVESALDELIANETEFPIVIFDDAAGAGSNVGYNVLQFLVVVLHGYQVTGAESERYFDFEFRRSVTQGICCDPDGLDTGALGIRLCGVDNDPVSIADRCGGGT